MSENEAAPVAMKMGITETLDVIGYADAVLKGLKANQTEGKIDVADVIKTVTQTSPSAVAAVVGAWNVPKELAELDDAERKKLLEASMGVVWGIVALFLPVKA